MLPVNDRRKAPKDSQSIEILALVCFSCSECSDKRAGAKRANAKMHPSVNRTNFAAEHGDMTIRDETHTLIMY